ncbi:MAG TPA: bifunctional DNA-formamidopyrimidine glycosylase/DNA-(apurinic or apyrimidinic site) lyase [bacterium]|nr:bifunctional DNA-formamidopyrimidine glycosylase/DNA-(apurinic or apyrimidinic site) lyase [bacterium]
MPELPDVETLARTLRRRLVGRRIRSARILTPGTVRSPSPAWFLRRLRGRRVAGVDRRGKYLLIRLDAGLVLLVHLRMTGDMEVVPAHAPMGRHTRVIFRLDDAEGPEGGGDEVRFTDQRRFGHIDLLPAGAVGSIAPLVRMGAEPLGRGFSLEAFRRILGDRRGTLKPLLLRQDVVAGIGNLYADEILFQARLHPGRRVESLRPAEVRRLHEAIRQVLRRATTALSRHGRPVGELLEAREAGGSCPRCGRPLSVSRLGGRATYFCPFCQRPDRPRGGREGHRR